MREVAGARVVNLRADDVGGQQVRRELDAAEAEVQPPGERADGQRFGQARHAFEQDVTAGQQADQQAIHHAALADNDRLDRTVQRIETALQVADHPVDFLDARGHEAPPREAWRGCSVVSSFSALAARLTMAAASGSIAA